MAINKNFVVRNGLEVANNLIIADDIKNKVGIGTTNPLVELDVHGDVNAYRFYGDQVRYPDWQFFGNLFGKALESVTSDFATESESTNTANFAEESNTANSALTAGTSTNADNVLIVDANGDKDYYIHFNDTISGYDDINISNTKLVFNPFSGNLGVNATNPLTNLQVDFYGVQSKTETFPSSDGTTIIDSFSITLSNFKTAEYTLLIENSTNIQTQKVLVMQNGTTSHYQEYSIMYEPTPIVSIFSEIEAGYCTLKSTPLPGITGNITYKFVRQTML